MSRVSLPSFRSIFPEYVTDDAHNGLPESHDFTRAELVASHGLHGENTADLGHRGIQPLRLPNPSPRHSHHHPSSIEYVHGIPTRTGHGRYGNARPHQSESPSTSSNSSSDEQPYYPVSTLNSSHAGHPAFTLAAVTPQLNAIVGDMRMAHDDDQDSGGSDSEGYPVDDYERKHVCPHCSKRFNRPSSLRIHVNTHTGATPFKCPWPDCGRNFNVNSNMRRHYRNHFNNNPTSKGSRAAGPNVRSGHAGNQASAIPSASTNFVFVTASPPASHRR